MVQSGFALLSPIAESDESSLARKRRRRQTLCPKPKVPRQVAPGNALDFPTLPLDNSAVARIVVEQLTKTFTGSKGETIRALSGFSLTIDDKELVAILGPSGCGKTTLLRLIAGLEEPCSGAITIDSQPMKGVAPKDRDIAMVFQNPALYPHMTVRENIAFALRVRKCPHTETNLRVNEAAELLGLTGCLDRRPAELSGGQCQRVALGRALVRRPKLLLLDEPLSNLDVRTRTQMRQELLRLHSSLGATMLYVTHDQSEALALGSRVAVLREGELQQVAQPMEIYRHPANLFVAEFIGSPPMNLVQGQLAATGEELFLQLGTGSEVADSPPATLALGQQLPTTLSGYVGKRVIFGIRPEHLAITDSAKSAFPPEASRRLPGQTEARVEMLERIGPDAYLDLRWGTERLVARVASATNVDLGKVVPLSLDLNEAKFFDPVTGRAIPCAC